MNPLTKLALKVAGGTLLFGVAFVGFAKLNGAELSELPVLGTLFPAPAEPRSQPGSASAPPAAPTPQAEPQEPSAAEPAAAVPTTEAAAAKPRPRAVQAGILGLLDADALYTQDELRALADSLRAKHREAEQRASELGRREELLADRVAALDERRRVLDEFAKKLDLRERELAAREAEANRDTISGAGGKPVPVEEISKFFADGDTETLAQRLASFTSAEAAQILLRVPPATAKELLDALPAARWREYAEAYARAAQQRGQ